ncbi:hypothetical protein VNI00_013327 [Paramarasmius palmivorus]|uniref:NmrA-like domain-containing protein n=1 Tax=Paramarasmius palmivorus TaxID=297713 RepID=A0AAW0BZR5_9AGAR
MSSKLIVLVTGATGYIGGSVLSQFLKRPDASSFEYRAVVRSAEVAEKLKAFGVTPILGSHSDRELMVKEASEADIVLAMADADDLSATEAVLNGLKKRYEVTGKRPLLVHTSGTASDGNQPSSKVYHDDDVAAIESVPATNIHRHTDVPIALADGEGMYPQCLCISKRVTHLDTGYVRTYIVVPSVVYGTARNALVDAGIAKDSVFIFNFFGGIAIKRGQGFTIASAGENLWPCIHIDELVDIYDRIFSAVLKDADGTPHGREGYYFGVSDDFKRFDLDAAIAKALSELGKAKSPEPTPLTQEEIDQYFGPLLGPIFASKMRVRANRAKKLGWKPTKTTKDFLATVKSEMASRV